MIYIVYVTPVSTYYLFNLGFQYLYSRRPVCKFSIFLFLLWLNCEHDRVSIVALGCVVDFFLRSIAFVKNVKKVNVKKLAY